MNPVIAQVAPKFQTSTSSNLTPLARVGYVAGAPANSSTLGGIVTLAAGVQVTAREYLATRMGGPYASGHLFRETARDQRRRPQALSGSRPGGSAI